MADIEEPKDGGPESGSEVVASPEDVVGETGLKATEASLVDAIPEEEVVRSEEKLSLKEVESLLKKAARKKESAIIAGRTIDDPAQALKNLRAALAIVKKHLKVDKSSLFFTSFTGATSGESTEDSEYIDALQLMHPAERLAHNIGHEVAHMKGEVDCEGLVEAYLRAIGVIQGEGDAIETTAKYNVMLEQFNTFAERARGKMDMSSFIKKIYKLYYKGENEKIFGFYEKNYIRGLETQGEKGQAINDFEDVFPELRVSMKGKNHGNYEVLRISDVVDEDVVQKNEDDVVIDARKRFDERRKQFDEAA